MTLLRKTTTLILAGALAGGCADDDDEASRKPDDTGTRAQALTTEVEDATAAPNGELDQASILALFAAFDDWDLCTLGGALPGGLDFDVDQIDPACVQGGDLAASVDLSCASGGAASGSVSYAVSIQGQNVYVHYVFDDVCVNGVCGDGEGAVEVGFDQTTGDSHVVVAGDLTLYFQGQWRQLKYGVTLTAGALGAQQDIVLWVDGQSYVIHLSSGSLGSSVAVEAGNGSWSCNLSASEGLYSGSCSGDAGGSIEF